MRDAPWSGRTGWHVARWGAWGWAETGIKLAAVVLGLAAAARGGAWSVPDSHALCYWILTAIGVAYVGAIADRRVDRELVSMVFVFVTIAGHAAIVYAMGREEWPAGSVRSFAALMLLGDVVKLGFFVRTGARVRALPRAVPIGMTALLAAAYALAGLAA